MNSEEFRLLSELSMYQDGVSKEDYFFNKWIYSNDDTENIEVKFNRTIAGLVHLGMAEKVAPPFFISSECIGGKEIEEESAFIYEYAIRRNENCITTYTSVRKCIGSCLYRITTKGREMLLGIHLLNGGEKEWMRVLNIRE